MAHKQSTDTKKHSSSAAIKCLAINSTGKLGLFYDAHRDHVIPLSNLRNEEKSCKSTKVVECAVMKLNKDDINNTLQSYGSRLYG